MRFLPIFLIALLAVLMTGVPASAQLLSPQPLCFEIRNDSGYMAMGHVETAKHGDNYHRQNFRLDPDKSTTVCTTGPFFEGYAVNVAIKSLFPVDQCRIEATGLIRIIAVKDPDTGRDKMKLDCSKTVM